MLAHCPNKHQETPANTTSGQCAVPVGGCELFFGEHVESVLANIVQLGVVGVCRGSVQAPVVYIVHI